MVRSSSDKLLKNGSNLQTIPQVDSMAILSVKTCRLYRRSPQAKLSTQTALKQYPYQYHLQRRPVVKEARIQEHERRSSNPLAVSERCGTTYQGVLRLPSTLGQQVNMAARSLANVIRQPRFIVACVHVVLQCLRLLHGTFWLQPG